VAVFLGIPFARAPVGPLRFAAPTPPLTWTGVRDAVEYGPTTDRVQIPDHIMPESVVPGDETLNLNVFTPGLGDGEPARLAVMVWFHGGGFLSGSPKNLWYEGASFTRDGVVVVSVDYRLGVDGFGLIEGAVDNRGVLDWIAALEWVQDNIAAFGGDPARVTIAGQSAGGGAVLTLLGIPRAQPLFRAAISLSGALGDVPRRRAAAFTGHIAAQAGVRPDRAGFASLTEEQIVRLQDREIRRLPLARALITGTLPTGPMIDGQLMSRPTLNSMAAGVGADKPALIVTADQEQAGAIQEWLPAAADRLPVRLALALFGLDRPTRRHYRRVGAGEPTRTVMGRVSTDLIFRRLALETVAARAQTGRDWTGGGGQAGGRAASWLARVAWPAPSLGAAVHCVDLPFFFDLLADPTVERLIGAGAPQALADELHGAAVKLIKGEDPPWEAWTPGRGATRVLDAVCRTELDGYADVRALSRPGRRHYPVAGQPGRAR
jgi:para-nitrobenzyl esterase